VSVATRATSGRTIGGWLLLAALFAAGGAAYMVAAQWLTGAVAEVMGDGRLLADFTIAGIAFAAGVILPAIVGRILLALFGQGRRAWAIILGWLLAYGLLLLLGFGLRGISLPVFAAVLVGFGLLWGWLLAPEPGRVKPARRQSAAGVRQSAVVDSQQFGRIPAETVMLLTQHARQARGQIATALPPAPKELGDFTIAAVLDRTLRDWWSNGNTHGLTEADVGDLKSFVTLAAALAGGGASSTSLNSPEGQAIYRATLTVLLDDWLANWNADGEEGPPLRRY
jgi:hypothetical protein